MDFPRLRSFLRQLGPRARLWSGGPGSTYALVTAAFLLLLSMAGSVTTRAHHMRDAFAEEHYAEGLRAERAGKRAEAEDRFRAALAVSRDHPPYRLALARVLLNQNRWAEAENHLKELAALDPTNGEINLLLARAHRSGRQFDSAVADYQRAIYGYWPPDKSDQRLLSRGEMVEMLAIRAETSPAADRPVLWRRLMPELMQWRDELPADSPSLREVARLFQEAAAPNEAVAVWERLRAANPKDASISVGLAKARFDAGDYVQALAAYRDALRLNRNLPSARDGSELTESIVNSDPAARRLSARERLARAIRLVESVAAEYDSCEETPELQQARQKLAEIRRRGTRDQTADEWIDLAETLWRRRGAACGSVPMHNAALPYVFRLLEKAG
ncbi:MAG: tetratricopeptide repeat protein [Bryobacteraceae bacterium]